MNQQWESEDYTRVQLHKKSMSEINYIKGLREGTSPINLKIIGEYQ